MRDSVRSEFTPSYKYNAWVKEKSSGATPMISEDDKELWEEELKK